MLYSTTSLATDWTAADLVAKFGAMPLKRVRFDPSAGQVTEHDVVSIREREKRLFELVDGVLVEKTTGYFESAFLVRLLEDLSRFVRVHKLGVVSGMDGLVRFRADLVLIPDATFVSWSRLPDRKLPQSPFLDVAPELAVEMISPSNTPEEMNRKLVEYFKAGVRLVWYIYPVIREIHVYTTAVEPVILRTGQTLDGGAVLPGFTLDLQEFFHVPTG